MLQPLAGLRRPVNPGHDHGGERRGGVRYVRTHGLQNEAEADGGAKGQDPNKIEATP
ncbi:MAG: hypothetical protein AMXMBFR53_27750 [Gemmatimonadota bacterium]